MNSSGPPRTTRAVAVGAPIPQADTRTRHPIPLVSIVVLTASGARHLPECLQSLRAACVAGVTVTEVIVVDNGSTEDPTSLAEQHYPGVRVLRTGIATSDSPAATTSAPVPRVGTWLGVLERRYSGSMPIWLYAHDGRGAGGVLRRVSARFLSGLDRRSRGLCRRHH